MDFNQVLGSILYPNTLELERLAIFGANATCTLYTVTPGAGEQQVVELETGWMARRIPTIESGAEEQWRLEIVGNATDWNVLKNVTKVRMRGATDEEQMYEVLDRYNAMKPGKVYQLRMQAICSIDPS